MVDRGSKSWCETVALQRRRDLKLAPTDPLPPLLLAASLGVNIRTVHEVPVLDRESLAILAGDSDGWSAVTLTDGRRHVVILNSGHSAARSSSDIMHELSHVRPLAWAS